MEPKNRTTAGLWAFFLGGYSAQYFYLGDEKAKTRLILAIFLPFMVLIYGFIGLVDAIKFFTMSDEEFVAYCRSNGYDIGSGAGAPAKGGSRKGATMSPADRNKALFEFKNLCDTGAITPEEFAMIKSDILGGK